MLEQFPERIIKSYLILSIKRQSHNVTYGLASISQASVTPSISFFVFAERFADLQRDKLTSSTALAIETLMILANPYNHYCVSLPKLVSPIYIISTNILLLNHISKIFTVICTKTFYSVQSSLSWLLQTCLN